VRVAWIAATSVTARALVTDNQDFRSADGPEFGQSDVVFIRLMRKGG